MNIVKLADNIMENRFAETEYELTVCSEPLNLQEGGATSVHRPTGGFPPIYLCEELPVVAAPRAFSTAPDAVSIKDIMAQRKIT